MSPADAPVSISSRAMTALKLAREIPRAAAACLIDISLIGLPSSLDGACWRYCALQNALPMPTSDEIGRSREPARLTAVLDAHWV
jgi:hypothetical protein